jgi:hypothetical protein
VPGAGTIALQAEGHVGLQPDRLARPARVGGVTVIAHQ